MHANEVDADEQLVRRLLRAQFPRWADLPIAPPLKTGTDNAIFRVGRHLSVRLPRRPEAEAAIARESAWLPRLSLGLPLRIPVPLAVGVPGEGFPLPWSVHPWIDGRPVVFERLADPTKAAGSLASFLRALAAADTTGAPDTGSLRGAPLATLDERVRGCIDELGERIVRARVVDAWERALAAPVHAGPPRWLHGDLNPGNILERNGTIEAVIDFGCMGVGDPACDLLVAWSLLRGPSRATFRRAVGADEAAWERGRGWALYAALIALPYYWDTNPPIVALSRHILEEVLRDGS